MFKDDEKVQENSFKFVWNEKQEWEEFEDH